MSLRVGCDLVSISGFRERHEASGEDLLRRLFHASEREGASLESLAGRFAAKEAACKALGLRAGAWLDLVIEHDAGGAPRLALLEPEPRVRELALSITHAGDYAVAVVAAVLA
jgi:holo-[acyl-carrier protein] synthase